MHVCFDLVGSSSHTEGNKHICLFGWFLIKDQSLGGCPTSVQRPPVGLLTMGLITDTTQSNYHHQPWHTAPSSRLWGGYTHVCVTAPLHLHISLRLKVT